MARNDRFAAGEIAFDQSSRRRNRGAAPPVSNACVSLMPNEPSEIVDRLLMAPDIPPRQMRAYLIEWCPKAAAHIRLLEEREAKRDRGDPPPAPGPTPKRAKISRPLTERQKLYASDNRRTIR